MLIKNKSLLRGYLKLNEGLRLYPYSDSTGNISIGYARNLTANGITTAEAQMLLDDDIDYFLSALSYQLPWFDSLDDNRQIALCDMCYNLGVKGLMEFTHMLEALRVADYDLAAKYALESKWAEQVGKRAIDDANIIRTGKMDDVI